MEKPRKYLIEGVNPIIISRIVGEEGYRRGKHPKYYRLQKKKWYGSILSKERGWFDGWYRPRVLILGSDGRIIKTIICKSNQHAETLINSLMDKLNEFNQSLCSDLK